VTRLGSAEATAITCAGAGAGTTTEPEPAHEAHRAEPRPRDGYWSASPPLEPQFGVPGGTGRSQVTSSNQTGLFRGRFLSTAVTWQTR
jgi:hypothetical protein